MTVTQRLGNHLRIGHALVLAALGGVAVCEPAQAIENLVVHIECEYPDGRKAQGSGVIVSPAGHVLTARHVAPMDDAKCVGRIGNNSVAPRNLIQSFDDKYLPVGLDGRLLSFAASQGETFEHAYHCPVARLEPGQKLIARAFHGVTLSRPSTTVGALSSTTLNSDGMVEMDVMVGPGKSGGPVFWGDTDRIVGIVAGAEFDPSTGLVSTYSMLAIDALIQGSTLFQEAQDCPTGAIEPELQSFKPSMRYFQRVLRDVNATPEFARDLLSETIEQHQDLFASIQGLSVESEDVQKALSLAVVAFVQPEMEPDTIRAALKKAASLQSDHDLLSGKSKSLDYANLIALQAGFEAALLNRRAAAKLYQKASSARPASEGLAAWDDLIQAGTQLHLKARDTNDNEALKRSISYFGQARDRIDANSEKLKWTTTQLKIGDAYRTLGQRECGIGQIELAEAAYQDALDRLNAEDEPLLWSELNNNLGTANQTRAIRVRSKELLESSIERFEATSFFLETQYDDEAEKLRSKVLHNLGNALQLRGSREVETQSLIKALEAYETALTFRDKDLQPYDWSATRTSQGNTLTELGRRDNSDQLLSEAAAAYRDALEVRSRQALPLKWAQTQNNLARVNLLLGLRAGNVQKIEDAIAQFNLVLHVRERSLVPIEWAHTMINLGISHFGLGDLSRDTSDFLTAKDALEEAVNARLTDDLSLRECKPDQWASAVNNLGNVLLRLAQIDGGPNYYLEAVDAYELAGEEWRKDTDPLEWARLQHNIGTAKFSAGQKDSAPNLFEEAAGHFAKALEIRDVKQNPAEWIESSINFGATRFWQGRQAGDAEVLKDVSALLDETIAVAHRNEASVALANRIAGSARQELFSLTGNASFRQEAIENFRRAEDYYLSVSDSRSAQGLQAAIKALNAE